MKPGSKPLVFDKGQSIRDSTGDFGGNKGQPYVFSTEARGHKGQLKKG